jgi:hypothetical protein
LENLSLTVKRIISIMFLQIRYFYYNIAFNLMSEKDISIIITNDSDIAAIGIYFWKKYSGLSWQNPVNYLARNQRLSRNLALYDNTACSKDYIGFFRDMNSLLWPQQALSLT